MVKVGLSRLSLAAMFIGGYSTVVPHCYPILVCIGMFH